MEIDTTLYGWHFTFNPYRNIWLAFHRDDTAAYYNGTEPMRPIYEDSDVNSLIEKVKNEQ